MEYSGKWIKITDDVPMLNHSVLVTRFGEVEMAYRTNRTASGEICWVIGTGSYESEEETNIKAWTEIPEPYKG